MSSNPEKEDWTSFMDLVEKIMLENYGEIIFDQIKNPRNNQPVEDSNGFIAFTGPCGDTMKIWLKIVNDTIEEIGYRSIGCDITQAVGSMLTEMVKGKKIADAQKITPKEINDALGGLPEDHSHCALLAQLTLQKAIENYRQNQSQS